jgi:hypothetical protein
LVDGGVAIDAGFDVGIDAGFDVGTDTFTGRSRRAASGTVRYGPAHR